MAEGDVDVAMAWGPLAGYFASRQLVPLDVKPIRPGRDGPVSFTYAISMGVRRDEDALHEELERVIEARRPEIDQILRAFGVPIVGPD